MISIGEVKIDFYQSALKKTGKFTLLESHKEMRVFTFNQVQQAFVGRTLVIVRVPLKLRVTPEVLTNLQRLMTFMTPKE